MFRHVKRQQCMNKQRFTAMKQNDSIIVNDDSAASKELHN